MTTYYVLWINRDCLRVWSGPYLDRTEAENHTAMRDHSASAFILESTQ